MRHGIAAVRVRTYGSQEYRGVKHRVNIYNLTAYCMHRMAYLPWFD